MLLQRARIAATEICISASVSWPTSALTVADHDRCDALLLAGTSQTTDAQTKHAPCQDLRRPRIPIVAVLGNHDSRLAREREIHQIMVDHGVCLDGDALK